MSKIVDITNRGFEVIEFKDHNGVECSIQQSSAIDFNGDNANDALGHPGSSLLWLGCNNARMHLNRAQVEALMVQLRAWLDTRRFTCALADEVQRLRAGNPRPVCPHIPSHEDCPAPLIIIDCEGHDEMSLE